MTLEIHIKARNLKALKRALDSIRTEDPDTAIAVQYNAEKVSSAIRSIGNCFQDVEGYEEYRADMIDLHKRFARVHPDGTLIRYNKEGEEDPSGTTFSVETSSKTYNDKKERIEKEHEETIRAQKERIDHFEQVTLEEKVTLNLMAISEEHVEGVDAEHREALHSIFKERVERVS